MKLPLQTTSQKMENTMSKEMEHVQRAAKAKSTFLSNMSHEIRTPLNVILGLSDIIKKGENQDKELFKKNIEGIDFSARNLLSIRLSHHLQMALEQNLMKKV